MMTYESTPSGRFKPNRRLCLSMSDFHPESWNPMWSVSTILTGLYSFMVETAPTLGSIETTTEMKRKLAHQSLDFNVRDKLFCKLFPDLVEMQEEQMKMRKEAAMKNGTYNKNLDSQMTSDLSDVLDGRGDAFLSGFMAAGAGILAIIVLTFAFRIF